MRAVSRTWAIIKFHSQSTEALAVISAKASVIYDPSTSSLLLTEGVHRYRCLLLSFDSSPCC